mgnify:CR=1 FL=1
MGAQLSTETIFQYLSKLGYRINQECQPSCRRFVARNTVTGCVHDIEYDPQYETEHEAAIRLLLTLRFREIAEF